MNIKLNSLLGVRAAYNPGCNGLVERQNRTTQQAMVVSLLEKQANWYYEIPSLAMYFRMSTHPSTGLTAHEMMFGRTLSQEVSENDKVYFHSKDINDKFQFELECM